MRLCDFFSFPSLRAYCAVGARGRVCAWRKDIFLFTLTRPAARSGGHYVTSWHAPRSDGRRTPRATPLDPAPPSGASVRAFDGKLRFPRRRSKALFSNMPRLVRHRLQDGWARGSMPNFGRHSLLPSFKAIVPLKVFAPFLKAQTQRFFPTKPSSRALQWGQGARKGEKLLSAKPISPGKSPFTSLPKYP